MVLSRGALPQSRCSSTRDWGDTFPSAMSLFPNILASARHPPDPSGPAALRSCSQGCIKHNQCVSDGSGRSWAPSPGCSHPLLPAPSSSIPQHPSASPARPRRPWTKEAQNKIQERGSGRRGPVSDQPDPQEEIIGTRPWHVPGDGMCRGMFPASPLRALQAGAATPPPQPTRG